MMVKVIIASVIAAGMSIAGHAHADIIENFEGVATGGLSISGWSASSANSTIVAGTTPDGSQYLRINDASASISEYATYTPQTAFDTTNGATISFMLRRESGSSNADFVIFAKNATTVVQTGIKSGGNFYYVIGGSTTVTITDLTATNGTWYKFDINYTVDAATLATAYSLAITDMSTHTVLKEYDVLAGRTLANNTYVDITSVQFKTTSASVGIVDIDGITIGAIPEPASLCILGFGCAALMFSKRR